MIRLLILGSTDWRDQATVITALTRFAGVEHQGEDVSLLMTNREEGAEPLAADWWRGQRLEATQMWPDAVHGRKAHRAMVAAATQSCTHGIAFIRNNDPVVTKDVIIALKAGVQMRVYRYDDDIDVIREGLAFP